jgi:hypothetical protein
MSHSGQGMWHMKMIQMNMTGHGTWDKIDDLTVGTDWQEGGTDE